MPSHHPFLLPPFNVTSVAADPFSFSSQSPTRNGGDDRGAGGRFSGVPAMNREGFGTGGIRFATTEPRDEEDADSGVCSPPLWKTSPSSSPLREISPPRHRPRSLSPASRTQAIARGRRELMEMVRDLPESSYELSLKDLVDHHHHYHSKAEAEDSKSRSENKKGQMKRSGSLDNGGFLLKMVFPIRVSGSRKKKKRNSGVSGNTCAKVSPKPPARTTSSGDGSGKGGDKEWWKKRSSGSQNSSNCSSSSSSRRVGGFLPRCWAFFRRGRRSGRAAGKKSVR